MTTAAAAGRRALRALRDRLRRTAADHAPPGAEPAAEAASRVLPDEPLAPYTTWRVGGPADLVFVPSCADAAAQAVRAAAEAGVPWRVLGGGSNLLVDDDGVDGLVVLTRDLTALEVVDGDTAVRCEAGVSLPLLVGRTARLGLAGLEGLAGIPGSVGGALVMNAGGRWGEIGDVVRSVRVLEADGHAADLDREACGFEYRRSRLGRDGRSVLSCLLDLQPGDPDELRATVRERVLHKKSGQPVTARSGGCVFKNPDDGPGAGALIDRAGLKGHRVGGAVVSPVHANFVVNDGEATCADVLAVIEHVRREVRRREGVDLHMEVVRWGRGDDPR